MTYKFDEIKDNLDNKQHYYSGVYIPHLPVTGAHYGHGLYVQEKDNLSYGSETWGTPQSNNEIFFKEICPKPPESQPKKQLLTKSIKIVLGAAYIVFFVYLVCLFLSNL